jgi:hypothetical protein
MRYAVPNEPCMTRLATMAVMPAKYGFGLRGRQQVGDRVRPLRLLLRLGAARAEDIPEPTGLLM